MMSVLLILVLATSSCIAEVLRIPLQHGVLATSQLYPYASSIQQNNLLHPYEYTKDYKFYYGDISIGTPPQQLTVAFTMLHFWITFPSSNCTEKQCTVHRRFNGSLSSTYNFSSTIQEVNAGLGFVVGNLCKDDITIQNKTIKQQDFIDVTHWPADFYLKTPFDGEFGLIKMNPIWKQIVNQTIFNRNVFSIYVTKDGGEIMFGDSNPAHYSGELTYFPVVEQALQWVITFDNATVGGQLFGQFCENTIEVGIANNIILTKTLMKSLASKIGATVGDDNEYKVPCNKVDSLPPVELSGQGKTFSIPAEYYVIQDGDKDGLCSLVFADNYPYDGELCVMLLGAPFSYLYYMEFDFENERVGLAPTK